MGNLTNVTVEVVDSVKKIENDKKVIASKSLRIKNLDTTISIPIKKNVSAEELLGHIVGLLDLENITITTIPSTPSIPVDWLTKNVPYKTQETWSSTSNSSYDCSDLINASLDFSKKGE